MEQSPELDERRTLPVHRGGSESAPLEDSFGRIASKLRISVTDRCNFRCNFCMPSKPVWISQDKLLSVSEIVRLTGVMANMGINRVRLSGGEPLLRPNIETLVQGISSIHAIDEVAITTNGALLEKKARVLADHGLSEVTVSLHSLKRERYEDITGTSGMFESVLAGLHEARRSGLEVKVNCVVTRGCNDDEILDFARLACDGDLTVRFIEYMPFDGSKPWDSSLVVSGDEILSKLRTKYELVPLERARGSTAANYYFKENPQARIGTITSITNPFCSDCDRIRLKADGKIVPCLFSDSEYDIMPLLRGGASDLELEKAIREAFYKKFEGVEKLIRENAQLRNIRPMHMIGG